MTLQQAIEKLTEEYNSSHDKKVLINAGYPFLEFWIEDGHREYLFKSLHYIHDFNEQTKLKDTRFTEATINNYQEFKLVANLPE